MAEKSPMPRPMPPSQGANVIPFRALETPIVPAMPTAGATYSPETGWTFSEKVGLATVGGVTLIGLYAVFKHYEHKRKAA
jgi:hypothetical protein